jgi:hypothetical protein
MEYIENQRWDEDAEIFKITTRPRSLEPACRREPVRRLPAATREFQSHCKPTGFQSVVVKKLGDPGEDLIYNGAPHATRVRLALNDSVRPRLSSLTCGPTGNGIPMSRCAGTFDVADSVRMPAIPFFAYLSE